MSLPEIKYCPGTLVKGHDSYCRTCLQRMFDGRRVNHFLPYLSPTTRKDDTIEIFLQSRTRTSIPGVQEKFSMVLKKNKLSLIDNGDQGQYILKSIPSFGKNADQMPANEHLTMQIARQVFGIETAENALIYFKDGENAYLTRRFDYGKKGGKLAKEDFASLSGKTPQTHGEHYKYQGNYLDLFEVMKKYLPAYPVEVAKLFQLIVFNYLFSNGDAHLKNFSLLETPLGDFRFSPAYDLLNTRLHIEDADFALEEGLLPRFIHNGGVKNHFLILAEKADLSSGQPEKIIDKMLSKTKQVEDLIGRSFLTEKAKRTYLQHYQRRIKKLS